MGHYLEPQPLSCNWKKSGRGQLVTLKFLSCSYVESYFSQKLEVLQVVVVHTFDSSTWEAEAGGSL